MKRVALLLCVLLALALSDTAGAQMGTGLAFSRAPRTMAGSSFSPSSLAGLVAWYRADMGVTIGTGVSAWADQSGTGDPNKNLTQATAANQPTLNAADAAYNNQATLGFGSFRFLVSGTWASPLAEPETVFIVGNYDGSASNQYMVDDLTSNRHTISNGGGAHGIQAYNGAVLAAGAVNATPSVFVALFNAASSSVWISQLTGTSGNTGTNNTRTGITLATEGGSAGAFGLNGKIAEVIVYNRALSAAEIAQVLTYAGNRYAIAIGP